MTRADTIARYVNAYTNALGRVVSNTVGYMAAADSEERGRIQRDLHAAMEQSRQHLHLAFLECLGGAAVAGEAVGPKGPTPRFVPSPTPEPPKPAGWVVRWGIPGSYRFSQGIGVELGVSDPTDAHVYTSKADAEADARTVKHEVCVLPVDAAGNVIEAEDIGATLRREECERKAARQSGVAWEAARAGEEAERLRTDLAAVKAERDAALTEMQWQVRPAHIAVSTDGSSVEALHVPSGVRVRGGSRSEVLYRCQEERAAKAETERAAARTDLAAVKAERDEVRAERDKWAANAGTLNASLRQVHTECDQLRAELDATLAERDALAAEVQRAREQKPVHLALVNEQGAVVDGYLIKTRALAEDDARRRACTVAPLYLAPVVRDHSEVIAQCEEALRESSGLVIATDVMRPALRAALSALRGAS